LNGGWGTSARRCFSMRSRSHSRRTAAITNVDAPP
jgi:hypothetical protein